MKTTIEKVIIDLETVKQEINDHPDADMDGHWQRILAACIRDLKKAKHGMDE